MIESQWGSIVRDYEVDFQGIVNNANYFHYLDNARAIFFLDNDINIKEYYDVGINIVLISTYLNFKKSLSFNDNFIVKSRLTKNSKIKFIFEQEIYLTHKEKLVLAVSSQSTICATKKGRPIFLLELHNLVRSSQNI